jgi:uncharacterized SAM-binding protein YcdF (DUF218 family)
MINYLSKFLPVLFYPVGLAGMLALGAIAAMYFNRKRTSFVLTALSVATLWSFSSPLIAHILVRTLESKYDQQIVYPKVPAIVLLGGCTRPAMPPRTTVEVSCTGDRVLYAARLYRQGAAPTIICTGGKLEFVYNYPGSEAMCMANILTDVCGIDTSAIIIEPRAENTHDHAPNVEKILRERGMKKEIILVTSAMHMYRSVRIFRKQGYTVFPAPADYWEDTKIQMNLLAFFPRVESLFASTNALHEYFGIIAYKMLGWI